MKHNVSVGAVFGRLTVAGPAPSQKGKPAVTCSCSCGASRVVLRGSLTQGRTASCGCLRREVATMRATSHGGTRSSEHRTWMAMRERCTNPKSKSWDHYGGRGINVCAGWGDFAAFLRDMGPRPSGRTDKRPEYTIDRKNNDGGYWCGRCAECVSLGRQANCRWADWSTQNENRRPQRSHEAVG